MLLGMYTNSTNNHSTPKESSAARHSYFSQKVTAARADRLSREILVFNFAPRPDAQFNDNEKYIAQLTGEIWIDAQDRIVSRLTGWPTPVAGIPASSNPPPASGERPPAVYVEMMRLPEGIWLPRLIRINGADYPKLFDGINQESIAIFSNYVRFSTEIKDVKVNTPRKP